MGNKIIYLFTTIFILASCGGGGGSSNNNGNSSNTGSGYGYGNNNNAPEITPGIIKGSVIFINVFTGLLPKLAAARVTL